MSKDSSGRQEYNDGSSPKAQQNECHSCGEVFTRSEDRQRHMTAHHTKGMLHVCDFPGCGKESTTADSLLSHTRTHTAPVDASPYEILGVPEDASRVAIKVAYRKLALKCHPDKMGGHNDKWQSVLEAYECIGDEDRRRRYDDAARVTKLREEAYDKKVRTTPIRTSEQHPLYFGRHTAPTINNEEHRPPRRHDERGSRTRNENPGPADRNEAPRLSRRYERRRSDANYDDRKLSDKYEERRQGNETDEDLIPTAIAIKNIPFAVKKEELVQVMTEMALPLPYTFNYHFDNGVFRGLAFARFSTADETATVIQAMNHLELRGRRLRVEYRRMLPQAERDRIEREKRLRRGQLEEQYRPSSYSVAGRYGTGSYYLSNPGFEGPSSGQNSKLEMTLSDADRRRICIYSKENPQKTQWEIAAKFGVQRSTVSKIIRQKEKYLPSEEDQELERMRGRGRTSSSAPPNNKYKSTRRRASSVASKASSRNSSLGGGYSFEREYQSPQFPRPRKESGSDYEIQYDSPGFPPLPKSRSSTSARKMDNAVASDNDDDNIREFLRMVDQDKLKNNAKNEESSGIASKTRILPNLAKYRSLRDADTALEEFANFGMPLRDPLSPGLQASGLRKEFLSQTAHEVSPPLSPVVAEQPELPSLSKSICASIDAPLAPAVDDSSLSSDDSGDVAMLSKAVAKSISSGSSDVNVEVDSADLHPGQALEDRECYICGGRPQLKRKRDWQKHVLQDLRPYQCLEELCSQSTGTYSNLRNLISHYLTKHTASRLFSPELIPCVFCNEPLDAAVQSRFRHLGRHMEEIAFTVVPRQYDEWEFYSESAASVPDAHKRPSRTARSTISQSSRVSRPSDLWSQLGRPLRPESQRK